MIKSIVDAVTIPVMAKVRIGHFVEAQASPIFIVMPTRLILLFCTAILDPTSHRHRLHR